jgi:hypothetical protein
MKKIAIVLFALSLSGCALFDAYFMAKYDNQEYVLINKIRTTAQLAQEKCTTPELVKIEYIKLKELNTEFSNFTQYIPRNPEANKMAKQLGELIAQSNQSYTSTSSPIFCKMKLQQVEKSAEKIQTVLGNKPR